MIDFAQSSADMLWFLGEWSLRWGVLIGLLAIWFHVRAPRRSEVRYAIAWSVLLAGLCLPLVPDWGPGFWRNADMSLPASGSETAADGPTAAVNAAPPDIAAPPHPPLTFPPGYTGSPVEPSEQPSQTVAARPTPDDEPAAPPAEANLATTDVPAVRTSHTTWEFNWSMSAVLMIAYGMGVAVMLCRLLLGLAYLARLRRSAVEGAAPLVELFEDCRRELGVRRATLGSHSQVASPIVCGLFRPCVIVPSDFGGLSRQTQRACLTHELTHVRRGDSWTVLLTETVRAVFFFHPLLHWLILRLNLEREYICDEAALRVETDQRRYAADLLSFGRRGTRLRFSGGTAVSMPFGRRSTVKARVSRLLTARELPGSSSPRRRLLLSLSVVPACAALGALRVEAQANSDPEPAQFVAAEVQPASEPTDNANDNTPDEEREKPQIRVEYTPEEGPGYGIEYHPVTITGTAVDSAGQPVSGATVWLGTGVVALATECPETQTDEDGRFEFVDVDVEVHRFRAGPVPKPTEGEFTVFGAATGYGFTWHPERSYRPYERPDGTDPGDTDPITTERAFYAGEPMDVTLRFEPPARLRGRVTDDDGNPLANARVELGHISNVRNPSGYGMYRCTYLGTGSDFEPDGFAAISAIPEALRATRTDENGFYELNHLRRDTNYIALIDPGPEYDPLGVDIVTQQGESERRTKYVGHEGEFNATCPAPRDVAVRVVASDDGQPLEGATVLAHSRQVLRAGGSGRSDQEGLALLRLVPGDYKVHVEPSPGQDYLGTMQELSVAADARGASIDVAVEPAAVVVLQVVDAATAEPVPGVSFEYETDTTRVRETLHSQVQYADAPLTNARGELRAALAPGRKRFVCIANRLLSDKPAVVGELVDLQPGTTTTLRFELPRPPAEPDTELTNPLLERLSDLAAHQSEMLTTLRARLSVGITTTRIDLPFEELQTALNELSPDDTPDIPALMRERFDQPFEFATVDVTVDGFRRRGDFQYQRPESGRPLTHVDVMTESVALFYSPVNAQADAFDRRTGGRGSSATFQLCRWPYVRDEWGDSVTVSDGKAIFERESNGTVFGMTVDPETGFLCRSHRSAASGGQAEWQFAPRTLQNGLVLPGLRMEVSYRDGITGRIEVYRIDRVELVDEFSPETFAIALPPGVNVLDWRNVPREGPRRPAAGVITGPVTDMLAYLNRREPRRQSIDPVIQYGKPAPALQIAHWLNADGATSPPDTDGKVVLIDFWGITCGFCVAQLDDVRAAHKHLGGDDFLLIGVHDADGTVDEVAEFARDRKLDYQLAIDSDATEDGWFGATTQAFGVRGIPQAAVIDQSGDVVYLGEFDEALLHVERLVTE